MLDLLNIFALEGDLATFCPPDRHVSLVGVSGPGRHSHNGRNK
jgi:hypothetical protein